MLFDRSEVTNALPSLQIEPSKSDDPAFLVRKLGDLGPLNPGLTAFGIGVDFEMPNTNYDGEFRLKTTFLIDGELANQLYCGGAYTRVEGDGRAEKETALAFCDALFDLRFSEVAYYSTNSAWTPWFGGIAWDWTAIFFHRRTRVLSVFAVTDSD